MLSPDAADRAAQFRPLTDARAIFDAASDAHAEVRFDEATATFDTSGFNSLTCHVCDSTGQPWILRAPRRADVATRFAGEAQVLRLVRDRLATDLALRVPDWQLLTPDHTLIGYPRLPGTPVVTVEATGPVWRGVDRQSPSSSILTFFGELLATLQRIATDDPGAELLPSTPIDAEREALARSMDAVRPILTPSDRLWARWQRWLADDTSWPTHTALVHGDLHPGHWLLEDGRITGLLDWTEARFTDPSVDFAMLFGRFGTAPLQSIVAAFERAGGRSFPSLVAHAEERWSVFPVLGAKWALRTGDEAILSHMRGMVRKAAGG